MRAAPAISCAMVEVVGTRAYRAAENIRHSLRNGFTAYNVISPENGSFASVTPERTYSQELDASTAASGPHVFAVRSRTVRFRHYQRPPPPVPRSRTIMTRPSERDGMAIDMPLFRTSGKAKYFLFWALTSIPKIRNGDLPVGSICRGCSRILVAGEAT